MDRFCRFRIGQRLLLPARALDCVLDCGKYDVPISRENEPITPTVSRTINIDCLERKDVVEDDPNDSAKSTLTDSPKAVLKFFRVHTGR